MVDYKTCNFLFAPCTSSINNCVIDWRTEDTISCWFVYRREFSSQNHFFIFILSQIWYYISSVQKRSDFIKDIISESVVPFYFSTVQRIQQKQILTIWCFMVYFQRYRISTSAIITTSAGIAICYLLYEAFSHLKVLNRSKKYGDRRVVVAFGDSITQQGWVKHLGLSFLQLMCYYYYYYY